MSEGLQTTLGLLEETLNEAANRVLLPAMDSPRAAVREGALRSVLLRRSATGHTEALRRLHAMDDRCKEIVQEHRSRIAQALRNAVLGTDQQLCFNGCRAAVWFREYDLIPALVNALEDQSNPNRDLAGATLLELTELLYSELAGSRRNSQRRDYEQIRRRVIGTLEQSAGRFSSHRRKEILQAFLVLVPRSNVVLRRMLDDPRHSAFRALVEVLSNSPAPGVIGLLLAFLDETRTPSALLSVMAKRADPKFLQYLLKKIGPEPSNAVRQNLKRIETVGWLDKGPAVLAKLDGAAQQAAVRVVMSTSTPRAQVFPLVQHLLLQGKPMGRRAAAEALSEFHGTEANELALTALDDEDPEVQANILVQLRRRGVLGALPRLLEMVNSPYTVVREAVRTSLAEFSFQRFLAAFDILDDEVRGTTGALVKKVDPDTIPRLRAELESAVCSRRLRGLAISVAMDAVAELEETIIALLHDDDHLVRVEAAKALARSESQASWQALEEAVGDRSAVVQEAASSSLRDRARAARQGDGGASSEAARGGGP